MADERFRLDRAVRHPKRGKSHRVAEYTDYAMKTRIGTACGLPARSVETYTEVIPLSQAAEEDLCTVCFRDYLADKRTA